MMIEKLRVTQSGDGRYHVFSPVQRSFDTREQLEQFASWIVPLCERAAGRELSPGDFANDGVAHADTRSDTERQRQYLQRKHELAALRAPTPGDERSIDQKRAGWADDAVERERIRKMTTAERFQHEMRKRLAASEKADAVAKADAELRANPKFVAALAEAERVALAAKFNPLLTQSDVDELQHQYDVLDASLDVDRYRQSKRVYDLKLADRFSQSERKAFNALDVIRDQKRTIMTEPEAEPTPEPEKPAPLFDREPEPAGRDSVGRELVRVYHDGGSSVISKFMHDGAGSETVLLELARDLSCHAEPA